jgi:predicted AlkP superfamily pyrophosphatase or phosphodiesterase
VFLLPKLPLKTYKRVVKVVELILPVCLWYLHENPFQDHILKKVLLCVIDGWTSRVLVPALEAGRLPNFTELARAGYLDPNCISIFPSITPAALASIITGRYPSDHGLAGVYWYDPDTEDVMYFGDDI